MTTHDPTSFLRSGAVTFASRNGIYKDNYKRLGALMVALFPNGITINREIDWNRFGVFMPLMTKLTRYCENWSNGGPADSMHDLMVYAAMLQELDELRRQQGEPEATP